MVKFETTLFLKSPLLSVPNLKLSELVRSTHFVTVRCSAGRAQPMEGLAFGQMASSDDST